MLRFLFFQKCGMCLTQRRGYSGFESINKLEESEMKIKLSLFVFFAFMLIACGADDNEETTPINDNENSEVHDDVLPDKIVNDDERDVPDEDAGKTSEHACSSDAALLYERGQLGLAAVYVIGSVVLSIAGLFAGLWLVRQMA